MDVMGRILYCQSFFYFLGNWLLLFFSFGVMIELLATIYIANRGMADDAANDDHDDDYYRTQTQTIQMREGSMTFVCFLDRLFYYGVSGAFTVRQRVETLLFITIPTHSFQTHKLVNNLCNEFIVYIRIYEEVLPGLCKT